MINQFLAIIEKINNVQNMLVPCLDVSFCIAHTPLIYFQ